MANELAKYLNSRRRLKDENAIKKQVKIAKEHRISEYNPGEPKQPHRYNKHHAMNCGNTKCVMCGNPRKVWKELTLQEKRQHQDMEISRLRHSNGIISNKDE